MFNYIFYAIMVVLYAVALPMTWKRFTLLAQQHFPDLSQGLALHLKVSFVVMALAMLLEAMFKPSRVENFIPFTIFGILTIWFSSVLTYWLFFRKGMKNALDAGIIKWALSKNKAPPAILIKIMIITQLLILMLLGLLMIVAGNAEMIAAWLND